MRCQLGWPLDFSSKATVDALYTRQVNTSMAVFEDDIGAIANDSAQVRAFLADATRGAMCTWNETWPASARSPLNTLGSARSSLRRSSMALASLGQSVNSAMHRRLAVHRRGGYDVAFLNEVCPLRTLRGVGIGDGAVGAFLSQAALWLTPAAARRLLVATHGCFIERRLGRHVNSSWASAVRFAKANLDIDKYTRHECFHSLRCLSSLTTRRRGAFGCGLFSQERSTVEPWRGQAYASVGR